MSKQPMIKPTPQRLLREFAEVQQLEATLLDVFAERTETPARVGELFRALYQRIVAHFEDVSSGIVREAAGRDESLRGECNALRDEQPALRSRLEHMRELTDNFGHGGSAESSAEFWERMETEFKGLVVDLTRHDMKQKRLIERMG